MCTLCSYSNILLAYFFLDQVAVVQVRSFYVQYHPPTKYTDASDEHIILHTCVMDQQSKKLAIANSAVRNTGSWHLILDLSSPEGCSINDGIDSDNILLTLCISR